MSDTMKRMVMGSMGVAGLVGLLSILDIVLGIPFSGQMVMDIMFIIGAAVVVYMGFETYKEMS